MGIMKRVGLTFLVGLSALCVLLGVLVQTARPDLLSLFVGGFFGSVRSAIVWLYVIGLALAVFAFLYVPRTWRMRTVVVVASGAVAIVMGALHATRFSRDFSISTVNYRSGDGIQLEASLYLPKRPGPYPGLVFVHGSAPLRRGAYEVLVEPLVRGGYAILLADKRGVGGSGGNFDRQDNTGTANIARLTSDVVAGVRFLAAHSAIARDKIGLIGISQAGWVAPLAAVADTSVKFMVLITGPTVSTREENVWSSLRGDHTGNAVASLADAEAILDTLSSEGVDARVPLSKLRIPALWLFGEDDNSIPTKKNIRVLDSLRAGGARYEYRVYENYDHALVGRNGAVVPRLAPTFRRDILAWLDSTVTGPR
jgi:dipeptidyl aminopeptidase/acylaminoacyl peptidase